MPGTYAHDAAEGKLADAVDISAAGTTTGSAVQVDKPGLVRFKQSTAAVTGTSVTCDTEIQGNDESDFSGTVISYGKFDTVTDSDDSETHYLTAQVYHKYVRAVTVVAGTSPVVNDLTITVEEPHYRQVRTDSA